MPYYSIHFILLLFFSGTISTNLFCPRNKHGQFTTLKRLIRRINTGKYNQNLKNDQQNVVRQYCTLYRSGVAIPIESLGSTIDALSESCTYDLLNEKYAYIISRSFCLFHKTPGFIPTLSKFIVNLGNNNDVAKGHWYEIIRAYEITQDNPEEKIVAFNQRIRDNSSDTCREIDIITNRRFIECKNRDWKYWDHITPKKRELKQQLKDQQLLTEKYNRLNPKSHLTFEISSFTPISSSLKKWLNKQEITYYESKIH